MTTLRQAAEAENNKQNKATVANEVKTTFAKSHLVKNDKITDTALIDICIALFLCESESNVIIAEQIAEVMSFHFSRTLTAKRIRKHIEDNIQQNKAFFTANFSNKRVCVDCHQEDCTKKCIADRKKNNVEYLAVNAIVASDKLRENAEMLAERTICALEQNSVRQYIKTVC